MIVFQIEKIVGVKEVLRFRSSHHKCSMKKAVLGNLTKSTGKTPVPESIF